MPTPSQILEILGAIATEQAALAIIWHVLIVITAIGILIGWRPAKKGAAVALSIPLLSVSILAWVYKNPFNGLVFLLFAIALAVVGLRRPAETVDSAPGWAAIVGVVLIIFGFVYPHFLGTGSWLRYLYKSPTGLIPCPTLSLVTGFALLANGFSSRGYSLVLGILGLFYAAFGAFRLGVRLDFVLGLGAVALLVMALTPGFGADNSKPAA